MSAKMDDPGAGLMGSLLGGETKATLRQHVESDDFGRECGRWAAEFAYETVWSRPGLDMKTRSAAVIGMLMALRQTEELKVHIGIALKNGLTVSELEEVLYLSVPYAGFPAANSAKQAMKQALREIENEESGK